MLIAAYEIIEIAWILESQLKLVTLGQANSHTHTLPMPYCITRHAM